MNNKACNQSDFIVSNVRQLTILTSCFQKVQPNFTYQSNRDRI